MPGECIYCLSENNKIYFKCRQCSENIVLCPKCFSCGVEIGTHMSFHAYSIEVTEMDFSEINKSSFFNDGWSCEEEDVLLDAVEHFGFGSWHDVADFTKTKSDKECENHYLKYYVNGSIGEATLSSETAMSCNEEYARDMGANQGRLSELTIEQQQELGYMLLREDFERDYDNEAEICLSGVSLHYTDSPADIAYKVYQVESYRERQKGRELRKVVAKNYDIMHDATSIGFRPYCMARKKRTREMKMFQSRFMPLARFMSKNTFLDLFHSLDRQIRLMNHVRTLLKLNKKGQKKLTGNFKRINENLNGDKKRRKKSSKSYK